MQEWKLDPFWFALGMLGQAVFFSRFLVQWIASERAGRSYIPHVFWWLSLAGSMLLLLYAIHRKDPVFVLGQAFGWVVYARNLVLADAGLVHNHYTLNDTRVLELLPVARQKGIGIINGSPFGSGLLSGREAPDWHPATERDRHCFRESKALCERRGVSLSKLALQFSSQNPEFPTTLFSSSRSESVRHNVQWHEEPLDLDLLAAVRQVLAPVMDKQWDYDAAVARLMKTGTPPPTDFGAAKSARNRDHARPLSTQAPTAGISPA